jgi:hypothetical protein
VVKNARQTKEEFSRVDPVLGVSGEKGNVYTLNEMKKQNLMQEK